MAFAPLVAAWLSASYSAVMRFVADFHGLTQILKVTYSFNFAETGRLASRGRPRCYRKGCRNAGFAKDGEKKPACFRSERRNDLILIALKRKIITSFQ